MNRALVIAVFLSHAIVAGCTGSEPTGTLSGVEWAVTVTAGP